MSFVTRVRISVLAVLSLVTAASYAQVPLYDWTSGMNPGPSGVYHSRSVQSLGTEADDPVQWLSPRWVLSEDPYAPVGGNDGAAWQGKGWNSRLTAGVQLRWGVLSATLEPQFSWAQNDGFSLLKPNHGVDGDYSWGLDRRQRYGTDPVYHMDWGNTEVRIAYGPLSVGFGTEAIWLGSASRNAIVLSDNAGGFPHIDLGTLVPWRTEWGTFEGKMLWGTLYDSGDYQTHGWTGDNDRFFHGLVLSYTPPVYEHLTLGAARVFQSPMRTLSWWKAFQSINDSFLKWTRNVEVVAATGEDDVDQLLGLYFDFHFPEVGFQAYGELAKNDHSWDWRDFLSQPEHALAWVLGVRQVAPIFDQWNFYFEVEAANIAVKPEAEFRPTGSWYRHGPNPTGYTLGGQLLGAAIGPGSNSQYFEAGVTGPVWAGGVFAQRVENDNDYFLGVIKPTVWPDLFRYDVSTTLGLKGAWKSEDWKVEATLACDWQFSRYWVAGNDKTGLRVEVRVTRILQTD